MISSKQSNRDIRTLNKEVYGYIREIEKQTTIIPKAIKEIIVQYFVCYAFEFNPSNELFFNLNDEDWNIINIVKTPATVRFGDYISCPDFSQTYAHLSENMEKLRKEYLISTKIKKRERNIDFNLNDVRFKNVSQCSSLSILPVFRAAFMIGLHPIWCGFGFATRMFANWNGVNSAWNGCCFLFGDGLFRTSSMFDGLNQGDDYQKNGQMTKMNCFCSEGDIVICEIDMNARIGRIFNEKGGESLIIGLPENEDICIIMYCARLGSITVVDAGFV